MRRLSPFARCVILVVAVRVICVDVAGRLLQGLSQASVLKMGIFMFIEACCTCQVRRFVVMKEQAIIGIYPRRAL